VGFLRQSDLQDAEHGPLRALHRAIQHRLRAGRRLQSLAHFVSHWTGLREFVDLIPTLSELLGFQTPSNLEGTSFTPLLAKPDQPWKSAVFQVQSPNEQMIRNRRYSYTEFKGGPAPVALYDLEKDPWETVNLADESAHAKIRAEMTALQAGWKAARPVAAR